MKKFSAFNGTRSFIAEFTTPVSVLSHVNPLHSLPPEFRKFHLRLVIPSDLFRFLDQFYLYLSSRLFAPHVLSQLS